MKIKLSKSQWEGIGKKAGWMKKSDVGGLSGDLNDILEGIVVSNRGKTPEEIITLIKSDKTLTPLLQEENVTDQDLLIIVRENQNIYRL